MKKNDIEKKMLASRLRNKLNEKYILSNGVEKYSLNENELKNIINEAIKNVFSKNNLL
nr:MAG TPA: hypothetical protein [Caudoviricetes sp.]